MEPEKQVAPPAPASNAPSHAQPIFLTIESKREESYAECDPIDLFNAIHRAYDFEEMEHHFIEVKGGYGDRGASYKTICRDLAGCDGDITGYNIGLIAVKCLEGDFETLPSGDKGIVMDVKQVDIYSNTVQIPIPLTVKEDADYKNIIVAPAKFHLSNTTQVLIGHIPPGCKYEVFFYVESQLTLPRLMTKGKLAEAKLEYEQFELPKLLKDQSANNE